MLDKGFFDNTQSPVLKSNGWVDKEKLFGALSAKDTPTFFSLLGNADIIDLSNFSITTEKLIFFAENIQGFKIKCIHMNGCQLNDKDGDFLGRLIKNSSELSLITLNDNDLTENIALNLLEIFKKHPNLLRLELKENNIDSSVFAIKEKDIISNQFQQAFEKAMQYFSIEPKNNLIFQRDYLQANVKIIF